MSTNVANRWRIFRAGAADIEPAAFLFDAYRQFYQQKPDVEGARAFLAERFAAGDSVFYLAMTGDKMPSAPLGFTQLYPSFSSVSMQRLWILNDLFVSPEARRTGLARALMEQARLLALETAAKGIVLETAEDNRPAQALYKSLGYTFSTEFRHYFLPV